MADLNKLRQELSDALAELNSVGVVRMGVIDGSGTPVDRSGWVGSLYGSMVGNKSVMGRSHIEPIDAVYREVTIFDSDDYEVKFDFDTGLYGDLVGAEVIAMVDCPTRGRNVRRGDVVKEVGTVVSDWLSVDYVNDLGEIVEDTTKKFKVVRFITDGCVGRWRYRILFVQGDEVVMLQYGILSIVKG